MKPQDFEFNFTMTLARGSANITCYVEWRDGEYHCTVSDPEWVYVGDFGLDVFPDEADEILTRATEEMNFILEEIS